MSTVYVLNKDGKPLMPTTRCGHIIGLCTQHHDLVHKDATWQKRLAKKKTGLNKKYGKPLCICTEKHL